MVATPVDLVARAGASTGLSDYGGDGWQEGLEQLVAAVATDIGRDEAAHATVEQMIVTRLSNRLRVEQ